MKQSEGIYGDGAIECRQMMQLVVLAMDRMSTLPHLMPMFFRIGVVLAEVLAGMLIG